MTTAATPPPDDDALVAELRHLATVADPVPDAWRVDARAGFAWAGIDATPARFAYACADDRGPGGRAGAGRPPEDGVRTVRWAADDRSVEIDLDVGADKVRLVGRVQPPADGLEVVAVGAEGRDRALTDSSGAFRFDALPRRPVCLVVGGDRPFKTGWLTS